MPSNTFYNEILTDHNLHPGHKHDLPDANLVLEGVNPSCGDDIWLKLKVEDGRITDGAFVGDGCAISQASADMMLDLIIGKSEEEAMKLAEIFLRMIKGEVTDEEMDQLEEASVLKDIFPYASQSEMCGAGVAYDGGDAEDGKGINQITEKGILLCDHGRKRNPGKGSIPGQFFLWK